MVRSVILVAPNFYTNGPVQLEKGKPCVSKHDLVFINYNEARVKHVFPIKHEEVGDTDVREQMYDAVHRGFIVPQPGYELPAKFGMFSDEGDKLVRVALQKFLAHPDVVAAAKSLKTPEARLAGFQDTDVESSEGNTYDEYFGYAEKP
jgi:hypothetical protein